MSPLTKFLLVVTLRTLAPWVGGAKTDEPQDIFTQRERVADGLWAKVAHGQRLIGSYELDIFFSKYDPNSIEMLDLFEPEFLSEPESWIRDFSDLGVNQEFSKAYFRALDVFMEAYYAHLTYADMDDMIDICEVVTGGDGFGYINRNQFEVGFKNGVLRGVSVMLLFIRFSKQEPTVGQYMEALTYDEFVDIYNAMDKNDNNQVARNEMATFWVQGNYGPATYARALFDGLDLDISGQLSREEWEYIFLDLDCRDWDGRLDSEEFWQLDMIVHGERYIGSVCTLRRDYYSLAYFLTIDLGLGSRDSAKITKHRKRLAYEII